MMRVLALFALTALGPASPPEERSFMLTGFDRIRVDGPFVVDVSTGSPGGSVSGDGAALRRVAMRVEGGVLVIGAGSDGWSARPGEKPGSAAIRVKVPTLRAIQLRGGSAVRVAEMRGDRVEIGVDGSGSLSIGAIRAEAISLVSSGGGSITLAGTAGQARLQVDGAGSVDGANMTANDATIVTQSSGAIRLSVRYNARITANGIGSVSVLGFAKCTVRGPGPVECADIDRR